MNTLTLVAIVERKSSGFRIKCCDLDSILSTSDWHSTVAKAKHQVKEKLEAMFSCKVRMKLVEENFKPFKP